MAVETAEGEILLRCRRAGSWGGLWRMKKGWAGVAFLGLVVSAIGWVNLLAAAVRGEGAGLSARPYEWFFTAGGGLVVILAAATDTSPWLAARRGRPVRLTPSGVTYAGRVTVPWSRFQRFDLVPGADGRQELVGVLTDAEGLSARLSAYRIGPDAVSLGDVDDRPEAPTAVRRWRDGPLAGRIDHSPPE
jgi:hypothetical protein